VDWVLRVTFDLLAQTADMDVYRAGLAVRLVSPDRTQQLVTPEDTATAAYQQRQELEFEPF
jgi:hypothetical protein